MSEEFFQIGGVVNLIEGERDKDAIIFTVPDNKIFVIEFTGNNAFSQPKQSLFYALQITTKSHLGIYPLAVSGNTVFHDPEFPKRFFGSQLVKLYADPNSQIIFTVVRRETHANVRVFVDMCGFLIS